MTNLRRRWPTRILAALVAAVPVLALHATEVRSDDVIYLAEWGPPSLRLKALYRTPLTSTRDRRSMIAYLAEGQPVEVIGLGDKQDYVKARVAMGPVQGWVDADALEAPSTEFIARLRDRRQKAEAHRDLIERHEVVTGMTRAEVRASLGKPDRVLRQRTEPGDKEQWVYITYKYLPHYGQRDDAAGQPRPVVSYRRVQAGQKVIRFLNDEVVGIGDEPTESSTAPPTAAAP
ncbi:MAG TPA: hypothetical protein VL486_13025 [Verrucomicrobiae bacterium]|nr:hypothetical protein [Verrucomicrobiae bacterium]